VGQPRLAAASRLGNRTLVAAAEAVLAMGYSFTGAFDDADVQCRAASLLIDATSDDELRARRDALGHLAAAELYLERFNDP
jgi:shikimate kinase